jgi:hypothetical protein
VGVNVGACSRVCCVASAFFVPLRLYGRRRWERQCSLTLSVRVKQMTVFSWLFSALPCSARRNDYHGIACGERIWPVCKKQEQGQSALRAEHQSGCGDRCIVFIVLLQPRVPAIKGKSIVSWTAPAIFRLASVHGPSIMALVKLCNLLAPALASPMSAVTRSVPAFRRSIPPEAPERTF